MLDYNWPRERASERWINPVIYQTYGAETVWDTESPAVKEIRGLEAWCDQTTPHLRESVKNAKKPVL